LYLQVTTFVLVNNRTWKPWDRL